MWHWELGTAQSPEPGPGSLKGAARCCQPRNALKLPLKAMAIPAALAKLHCRCGHALKCTESAAQFGSSALKSLLTNRTEKS